MTEQQRRISGSLPVLANNISSKLNLLDTTPAKLFQCALQLPLLRWWLPPQRTWKWFRQWGRWLCCSRCSRPLGVIEILEISTRCPCTISCCRCSIWVIKLLKTWPSRIDKTLEAPWRSTTSMFGTWVLPLFLRFAASCILVKIVKCLQQMKK